MAQTSLKVRILFAVHQDNLASNMANAGARTQPYAIECPFCLGVVRSDRFRYVEPPPPRPSRSPPTLPQPAATAYEVAQRLIASAQQMAEAERMPQSAASVRDMARRLIASAQQLAEAEQTRSGLPALPDDDETTPTSGASSSIVTTRWTTPTPVPSALSSGVSSSHHRRPSGDWTCIPLVTVHAGAQLVGYQGYERLLTGPVDWITNRPEPQCKLIWQRRLGYGKSWRKTMRTYGGRA